jgi:hypothetical protein
MGGGGYYQRSYTYTLEERPPSAFVRPVVGEGLCTLTDFCTEQLEG